MEATINTTAKIHHATRAKAERLIALLAAEYPAITIAPATNEDDSQVEAWIATHTDEEGESTEISRTTKIPEIADLLEACADAELDPEAGTSDEEPEYSGSVVAHKYHLQYKEASTTGTTCGDWLAEWLTGRTTDGTGRLLIDELVRLFEANELDLTAKWAQVIGQKGGAGRYRMNGRQVLEKQAAKRGFVIDHAGERHDVPADALEVLRTRHAKWLAKEAKRDAAKDEVAEAAAGK